MLDVVLEVLLICMVVMSISTFNPCCAGCSSGRSTLGVRLTIPIILSILVVLDVVLEDYWCCHIFVAFFLSILVVLDVVLEDGIEATSGTYNITFNPCCAGCSSGRHDGTIADYEAWIFQSLLCWM